MVQKPEAKLSFVHPRITPDRPKTGEVNLCPSGANDGLCDQWCKTPIPVFGTLAQGCWLGTA